MGGGLLPTCLHNGKLYFLFGKENKYEKSAPGFSDFGGGTEVGETPFQTATREAVEELTGFIGSVSHVRSKLAGKKFWIDYLPENHTPYRTYIYPMAYDERLPHYFNNNRAFLGTKLTKKVITETRIFEKEVVRWICIDELDKLRPTFRFFYGHTLDELMKQKDAIKKYVVRKMRGKKGTQRR